MGRRGTLRIYLGAAPGALLPEGWGPAYENETNYLRVYLAQLRRKLEPDPAHPRHLITEPGMGYRFETNVDAEP